jgi:hypothetical protein
MSQFVEDSACRFKTASLQNDVGSRIERDHANRRAISAEILEQVPAAAVLLSSDEAHFHISGAVVIAEFVRIASKHPPPPPHRALTAHLRYKIK